MSWRARSLKRRVAEARRVSWVTWFPDRGSYWAFRERLYGGRLE